MQPFSETSIIVQILSHQHLDLGSEHILSFLGGIALACVVLWEYFRHPLNRIENMPYYFLSFFLISSSVVAFSG